MYYKYGLSQLQHSFLVIIYYKLNIMTCTKPNIEKREICLYITL